MILQDLTDRAPGDVVYLCGTPYKIIRIVNDIAYVTREGSAGRKVWVLRKEGSYFTVSLLKGDKTEAWSHCGVLHYLKPLDIYPGLE